MIPSRTRVATFFEYCRVCGAEMASGAARAMGICHGCLFDGMRKKKRRLCPPVYSFVEGGSAAEGGGGSSAEGGEEKEDGE